MALQEVGVFTLAAARRSSCWCQDCMPTELTWSLSWPLGCQSPCFILLRLLVRRGFFAGFVHNLTQKLIRLVACDALLNSRAHADGTG
jgi:hypothetical protein